MILRREGEGFFPPHEELIDNSAWRTRIGEEIAENISKLTLIGTRIEEHDDLIGDFAGLNDDHGLLVVLFKPKILALAFPRIKVTASVDTVIGDDMMSGLRFGDGEDDKEKSDGQKHHQHIKLIEEDEDESDN